MDTLEATSPVASPGPPSGRRVPAREEKSVAMTSVPAGRPEDGPSRSEEDRRLLIRYHRHGDQAAREQLVQRLLPLARRMARRSRDTASARSAEGTRYLPRQPGVIPGRGQRGAGPSHPRRQHREPGPRPSRAARPPPPGRPRTRAQLAEAMQRHGVPEDAAAAVLARFAEVGLIDDAAQSEYLAASVARLAPCWIWR